MIPNNISELNRLRDEAKSMVTKRASASAAVVPVPGTGSMSSFRTHFA